MSESICEARADDAAAVIELWEACGLTRPWNDPRRDFALALDGATSTVLILRQGDILAGSVMVGFDGHRGWIYYLAVAASHAKRGLGRGLSAVAEDWLRARGVPKLMLLVRPENEAVRGFYGALGYEEEPRIIFSKRLDQKG